MPPSVPAPAEYDDGVGFRDFVAEWRARRAGRRFASHDIRRSARDIIGPTGYNWSGAWELLDERGEKYLESFDRRIPPSEFVSKRDRTRLNIPIPLAERCLEDLSADDEDDG